MGVHYKFMSAKDYETITFDGTVISVAALKRKIFEFRYKSKKKSPSSSNRGGGGLCLGTDCELVVVNAQTNEEYVDDSMLIPNNSSVLIRRVPGNRRRNPIDTSTIIVVEKQQPLSASHNPNSNSGSGSSRTGSEITTVNDSSYKNASCTNAGVGTDSYRSAFAGGRTNSSPHLSFVGGAVSTVKDLSSINCSSKETRVGCGNGFGDDVCAIPGLESVQADDEDMKIKALVNTQALDWQFQGSNGCRGFGRVEKRTPPEGYVCHRCQVPGHFIQHCPTNGDPDYDFKRMRPHTGFPKLMLKANLDGSSALSDISPGVLCLNEDAFAKEIECPTSESSRFMNDVPQELLCPLCKQVMKCAVLTSKCCFKSFCDKCIRDHLMLSRLKCVCGATEILTDYLIPNVTVRDTINRILESSSGNSSSHESVKSNTVQVENKESASGSSKMISAESSDEQRKPSLDNVERDIEKKGKLVDLTQQMAKKVKTIKAAVVSEATARESESVEANEGEVEHKVVSGEIGKKKRKRRSSQDADAGSFMMPVGSYVFSPYWAGMEGYIAPHYAGAMSYGLNPFGMPFQYSR